jgi:hypothetical protein
VLCAGRTAVLVADGAVFGRDFRRPKAIGDHLLRSVVSATGTHSTACGTPTGANHRPQLKATRLALELNNGDHEGAELLMAWLERKTELLISALWPQVGRINDALLVKEKLSGREVCEIMARRL